MAIGLAYKRLFVPYLYQRPAYSIIVTPLGWLRLPYRAFTVDVACCVILLLVLVLAAVVVRWAVAVLRDQLWRGAALTPAQRGETSSDAAVASDSAVGVRDTQAPYGDGSGSSGDEDVSRRGARAGCASDEDAGDSGAERDGCATDDDGSEATGEVGGDARPVLGRTTPVPLAQGLRERHVGGGPAGSAGTR